MVEEQVRCLLFFIMEVPLASGPLQNADYMEYHIYLPPSLSAGKTPSQVRMFINFEKCCLLTC